MSNINLYQEEQTGEKMTRAVFLDKGLIIGVIIFAIVLLGYGGVKMYLGSLDQKIAESKIEEDQGRTELKNEDVNLAASFQQRMERLVAGKAVFVQNDPATVFKNVQDTIIPGVVVSRISFDDKILNVSFKADNFEVLAKQILGFKKNSAFGDVQVNSSARGEKGDVTAEIAVGLSR